MGRIGLFPLLLKNGCSQSSRFLPQASRIVSSGDENGNGPQEPPSKTAYYASLYYTSIGTFFSYSSKNTTNTKIRNTPWQRLVANYFASEVRKRLSTMISYRFVRQKPILKLVFYKRPMVAFYRHFRRAACSPSQNMGNNFSGRPFSNNTSVLNNTEFIFLRTFPKTQV